MRFKSRHEPQEKVRFRLPIQAYLLYLAIASMLLTGVSFARYVATGTATDEARVAAAGIEVTWGSDSDIEISNAAGGADSGSFSFTVSNKDSEVAIGYDVVVTLGAPLPDGVTIALDNKEILSSGQSSYTFSNAGTFEPGYNTKTHTLTFNGDYNIITAPFDTDITITINAEQID